MSREIKFRVWDIPNDEWLIERADGMYETPCGGSWSTLRHCAKSVCFVVHEYTGLTDKNGVEIYEGDFIKRGTGLKMTGKLTHSIPHAVHRVFFKEGAFRLRRGLKSKKFRLTSAVIRQNGIEVVGNIHEHPELLP